MHTSVLECNRGIIEYWACVVGKNDLGSMAIQTSKRPVWDGPFGKAPSALEAQRHDQNHT